MTFSAESINKGRTTASTGYQRERIRIASHRGVKKVLSTGIDQPDRRGDCVLAARPIDIAVITEARLKAIAKSVEQKHNIVLLYDKSVIEVINKEGYSEEFGARHLGRAIQRLIEIPLTQRLIAQPLNHISRIRFMLDANGVIALKGE